MMNDQFAIGMGVAALVLFLIDRIKWRKKP